MARQDAEAAANFGASLPARSAGARSRGVVNEPLKIVSLRVQPVRMQTYLPRLPAGSDPRINLYRPSEPEALHV